MLKSKPRIPIKRVFVRKHLYNTSSGGYSGGGSSHQARIISASEGDSNLICSRTDDGFYAPVLDLDFPAQLVPSMSDNHYHLYLDKRMTKKQLDKLLAVLVEVGLVEKNWVKTADDYFGPCVRKPAAVMRDNFGVDEDE